MDRNTLLPSGEGDRRGLELGREQGNALERTLRHMLADIAEGGEEREVGQYLVALAYEKAEGMYQWRDSHLEWIEPGDENVHLEVVVRDASDGRFIPGLDVIATILDRNGTEIGTHALPLLWHPYLYHYGRNWRLPDAAPFTVRIAFDAPKFPRHDKKNGRRFLEGATVEFTALKPKLGQD